MRRHELRDIETVVEVFHNVRVVFRLRGQAFGDRDFDLHLFWDLAAGLHVWTAFYGGADHHNVFDLLENIDIWRLGDQPAKAGIGGLIDLKMIVRNTGMDHEVLKVEEISIRMPDCHPYCTS